MNENDRFWMFRAMSIYGGSFVKNLGMAWMCADKENSAKLEKAFPELVKKYIEMGERLQVREKDDNENESI